MGQDEGCEGLHAAARRNDTATIRELVHSGVGVDCRDGGGRTSLLVAVRNDAADAARTLIQAGADVNAQDNGLESPLLYAAAEGRLDMLKLCLAAGPDFTVYNRFGGTPLIPACDRGHVEVVEALLRTGAVDVNHVNRLGWTALLEAILLSDGGPRHQRIVRLLLEHGADIRLADKDGVTPLQHARRLGYTEIVRTLEDAGAQTAPA